MKRSCLIVPLLMLLGCVEGGNLEVSAGAPVSAAVGGRITLCGRPVSGAEVRLLVEQSRSGQARPVVVEVGPAVTDRSGSYLLEVAPGFAVPGPAQLTLRVTANGTSQSREGTLEFRLGLPPRDTTRMDADLGVESERC